ncbi:MAG: GspMb/PilO family protein [Sporomusaceae bacterium]|nr:GspMb/PilO family protein [Sporomusaceae bacterium]
MPMSAVSRRHLCVVCLGLMLLLWLFAVLVYWPWQQRMTLLQQQLQQELAVIELAQRFIIRHPDPPGYLRQLDQKLAVLNRYLPPSDPGGDLFSKNALLFDDSGLRLLAIKSEPAGGQSGYGQASLEMTVSGDFFQIMRLINQLESGPPFMLISHIRLQLKPAGLESTIMISHFFQDRR